MSVIFILIGCSLLLASSFLVAFLWANKEGQFEDDYTPSVRMLFEDGVVSQSGSNGSHPSQKGHSTQSKKNSSIKPSAHVTD